MPTVPTNRGRPIIPYLQIDGPVTMKRVDEMGLYMGLASECMPSCHVRQWRVRRGYFFVSFSASSPYSKTS